MKKIFTLALAIATSALATANSYTDSLSISINGAPSTIVPATINVEEDATGMQTYTLRNFVLNMQGNQMPVGNVQVSEVKSVQATNGKILHLGYAETQITPGDDPNQVWVGPAMGMVEIRLISYEVGDKLYANLDIDAGGLEINCKFGSGFQLLNSGFEHYHTATFSSWTGTAKSDEPDHWHSFMSADGTYASFVAGTPHTFISNLTAPGSSGQRSLMLTSGSIFGIVANGTVTTGRMTAGAISAADTGNHASIDLSNTAKDAKGDPFYQQFIGRPDSLALWVRFIQGTPNAAHPYATVSAAITDGTYYQEPQDKEYTNIVGIARHNTIATNGGEWQRIVVPFDYESYKQNNATPKAMLLTISTNADPGQGSDKDTLYVDDIEMIYNADVQSVQYNGRTLTTYEGHAQNRTYTVDAQGEEPNAEALTVQTSPNAIVLKDEVETNDEGDPVLGLIVLSEDLSSYTMIDLVFTNTTGIRRHENRTQGAPAYYNMNGQRIAAPQAGSICIVKQADGSTKKYMK